MNFATTIFLSLLLGIFPTLIWLWFWLKEDSLHPEPKSRIFLVFICGMLSVFAVLPAERYIFSTLSEQINSLTILIWATIEEVFKFLAVYWTGIRTRDDNEPLDPVIYMITVALGFSALENSLFLSNLISDSLFFQGLITGNSRFIGATLLHVASSSAIGVMLGLSFYKKPLIKKLFLFTGIILSIVLHTIFNLLIIRLNNDIFLVFSGVWIAIITLIVVMEKLKTIKSK